MRSKHIRIKETSPFAGKTLAEAGFRKNYEVTVLAIKRGKETLTNPSGDIQLLPQDIVILIGTRDSITKLSSVVLPGINSGNKKKKNPEKKIKVSGQTG